MRKKDIFIVLCRNRRLEDWTTMKVSQECYSTKEDAIKFIESRLDDEEKEFNETAHNRKMLEWYEYFGDSYTYYIKVLELNS